MNSPSAPTLLYCRPTGHGRLKQFAPPRTPETPAQRLRRLGEQALYANGVTIRWLNPDTATAEGMNRFTCTSQERGAAREYYLRLSDNAFTCTCQTAGAVCAHRGAVVLYVESQQREVWYSTRAVVVPFAAIHTAAPVARDRAALARVAAADTADLYGPIVAQHKAIAAANPTTGARYGS